MITVFVQAPSDTIEQLRKVLGDIKQSEYFFVILPLEVKLMTKREVKELLLSLPDSPSPD